MESKRCNARPRLSNKILQVCNLCQIQGSTNESAASSWNDILDWLCPPQINPEEDQDSKRELYIKDTGAWIFRNKVYEQWASSPGSFLWLHGQSEFSKINSKDIEKFSGFGKNYVNVKFPDGS